MNQQRSTVEPGYMGPWFYGQPAVTLTKFFLI